MKLPVLKKFASDNMAKQISDIYKEQLEKQAYRVVGNHSAVKVCHWTKSMIKNEGGCYKFVFYGIRSHQCLQMTTSMFCASRCTFCWRGTKAPVSKEWYGPVDEPEHIINHAIDAHLGLLEGFNGNPKSNKVFNSQKDHVRHVALSLTGEPITYPKINEILKAFHAREISTFLVTNAQFPDQIAKIDYVTQLYLSIDAPNKDLLLEVDRPLFGDFHERMIECLDLLATRKYRTCVRLTVIQDLNDVHFDQYAELMRRGDPDFIECKGYMYVGHSQKHLTKDNMPDISDVKEFGNKLLEKLDGYEFVSEHPRSRAILLMKKSLNKKCFIDYPNFFSMIKDGVEFGTEDYSSSKMQPNC